MKPNVKKGWKRIWIVVSLLYSIPMFFYVSMEPLYTDFREINSQLDENLEAAKFFREKGFFDGLADNIERVKLQLDQEPETESIAITKYDALWIPDDGYVFTEFGAKEHASERKWKTFRAFLFLIFILLILPQIVIVVGIISTRFIAKGFGSTPTNEA